MRLKMYQDQDNRQRGRARIARLLLPALIAVLSPAAAAAGAGAAWPVSDSRVDPQLEFLRVHHPDIVPVELRTVGTV